MKNNFKLKFITVETMEEINIKFLSINDLSGSLGIYPGHINYITALDRGIGYFLNEKNEKTLIAYDYGILKVENHDVSIITRTYIKGEDYQKLKEELYIKVQKVEKFEKQLRENLKILQRMIMKEIVQIERG